MQGIRIFGLETLTKFEPITVVGNYTIQNNFAWEKLTLEVRVSVEIQPSSEPDALLKDSTPETIVENMIILVDLANPNVDLALFLAIDQSKLDELRLGSFLAAALFIFYRIQHGDRRARCITRGHERSDFGWLRVSRNGPCPVPACGSRLCGV
jgi:hypothetical protein